MDQQHTNLRFNLLIAFLVILTLLTVRGLQSEIQRVHARIPHDSSHEIRQMEHRIHQLQNRLDEIHEQSRWITGIELHPDPDASAPGAIVLDVDWSFRELDSGARVTLLYREEGRSQWTDVPAEPTGTGGFRARMILRGVAPVQYRISAAGEVDRSSEVFTVPGHLHRAPEVQVVSSSVHGPGMSQGPTAFTFHMAPMQTPRYPFHRIRAAHADLYVNGTLDRSIVLQTWDEFLAERQSGPDSTDDVPGNEWARIMEHELRAGYSLIPDGPVWFLHMEDVPVDRDPDPVARVRFVYEDLSVQTYLLHLQPGYMEPLD